MLLDQNPQIYEPIAFLQDAFTTSHELQKDNRNVHTKTVLFQASIYYTVYKPKVH